MFVKLFARRRVSRLSHASGHAVIAASLLWGAAVEPVWAQASSGATGEASTPAATSPESPKAPAAEITKPKAKAALNAAVKPAAKTATKTAGSQAGTQASTQASKSATKVTAEAKRPAKAEATVAAAAAATAGAGAAVVAAGPSAAPAGATAAVAGAAAGAASGASGASGTSGNGGLTHPIFVLNSLDATISVIDPQTWTETKRIPTGKEPHHLYLTPDEKSLIVANALGDSLTFLDPRTAEVQRTVRGIIDPYQLRFSPDMKWMVTAGNRLNHVDIYRWDGKDVTLSKRISTGKTPSHLWIDSTSSIVYSTMQDSDELVAIDLNTQALKWRIKTGSLPADVYGSPDDKTLFIGLTGGEGVEVYDVSGGKEARLVKTIPTGKGAHAFRGAGDRRHIYVSNRVANTLSKIDMQTQTVVAQLPGPTGPDCMDVSADGRLILLSSRWGRKMTVIDTETRKVLRQVSVGKSPHGVWTLDHAPR